MVHEAREAVLTRRVDDETLFLWRRSLERAVDAAILHAGTVLIRSVWRRGGH